MSGKEEEDTFMEFLWDFSEEYKGNDIKKLRFLLYDFLPISLLARKDITGFLMFSTLKTQGNISIDNLIILSEIAELTKVKNAKTLISGYANGKSQTDESEDNQCCISTYRKCLFAALLDVDTNTLTGLRAFYELDKFGYQNIWDLVFHLEKEQRLNDSKATITRFAKVLNKTAKSKLTAYLSQPQKEKKVLPALKKSRSNQKSSKPTDVAEIAEEGISDMDFKMLLIRISDWYRDRHYTNVLKVLFNDILVKTKETPKTTTEVFNMLQTAGELSHKNVDVLVDMIKVTNTRGVLETAKELSDAVSNDENDTSRSFTPFRRKLIKIGNVLTEEEATKIGNIFSIPMREYNSDPWSLILTLERDQLKKEENIQSFIKYLKNINLTNIAGILESPPGNKRPFDSDETAMSSNQKKYKRK